MLHLALLHEYNMVLSIFLPVFQFMSFLWRHYNITLYLQFHNFPLFYIFGRDISFVLFLISLFLLLLDVLSSVFFPQFLVFFRLMKSSFLLYPLVILIFFHKLGKTVLLLHFPVLSFGMRIVLVLLTYPILYPLLVLLQIHIT